MNSSELAVEWYSSLTPETGALVEEVLERIDEGRHATVTRVEFRRSDWKHYHIDPDGPELFDIDFDMSKLTAKACYVKLAPWHSGPDGRWIGDFGKCEKGEIFYATRDYVDVHEALFLWQRFGDLRVPKIAEGICALFGGTA